MKQSSFIKINPADSVVVCLRPFKQGEIIEVDGKTITSTKDIEGYNGLEYIKTEGDVSYFQESTLASAPSFAFIIDGITELNQNFG